MAQSGIPDSHLDLFRKKAFAHSAYFVAAKGSPAVFPYELEMSRLIALDPATA